MIKEVEEGPETGHEDNRILIEREMEYESSYDIKEAATRGKTYEMGEKTNYWQHFALAVLLITLNGVFSGVIFYYIAKNELTGNSAIIIGSIQGNWQALAMAGVLWWFGSTISSNMKSRSQSRQIEELTEDER